ncbi:MAG: hypothetical protein IJX32_01920 [Spirochaetaceae bacterium]|nr:hypothetical protein [Spirochaetaceae bacterium]
MDFINNVKIIDMRVVPGDSGFLLDDGETSILYDTGFAFTGDKKNVPIWKIKRGNLPMVQR